MIWQVSLFTAEGPHHKFCSYLRKNLWMWSSYYWMFITVLEGRGCSTATYYRSVDNNKSTSLFFPLANTNSSVDFKTFHSHKDDFGFAKLQMKYPWFRTFVLNSEEFKCRSSLTLGENLASSATSFKGSDHSTGGIKLVFVWLVTGWLFFTFSSVSFAEWIFIGFRTWSFPICLLVPDVSCY